MSRRSTLLVRRRAARWLVCAPIMGAALMVLGGVPGGATGGTPGIGWSQAPSLPAGFTPRWDFAYGYYPPSDQVVVFGGAPAQLAQGWYSDTYLYSGGAWSKGPAAPAGLTARGGASMAYDPVSQRLVMFGGSAPNVWPPSNETWLWDGIRWNAGPAAPASLHGRTGAGMAYDDDLGKIVLFAGTGEAPYKDVWLYNGATNAWTAGPTTPAAVLPRAFFGMTYDPTMQRIVVFGGDGTPNTWYFDGAAWTSGPPLNQGFANTQRERTQLAYDPQLGADVLFSGLGPTAPLKAVYYLRSTGWSWLLEDPAQPQYTAPPSRLEGAVLFVPSRDALLVFGGVNSVNDGTTARSDAWYFRDVAPTVTSATLDAYSPRQTDGIHLLLGSAVGGYHDTTRTIQWFRNGSVISGESSTYLAPQSQVRPGDTIVAKVQYVDALGVVGPLVSTPVATVAQPTLTVNNGTPGSSVATAGTGYGAGETVDLRMDSPTGPVIKTIVVNAVSGGWSITSGKNVSLPKPLLGGTHTMYATGESTGSAASTTFTVLPGGSISPTKLGSGASTVFSGAGFRAGETATLKFPGGTPVTATADANGSLTKSLTSPPEPHPGGVITATAASGNANVSYSVTSTLNTSGSPKPGAITLVLTGYGASETVVFTMDGATQSFVTDAKGSLTATVTLRTTWGKHTIKAAGATSGVSMSKTVNMKASMTLTPGSGPVGTVVSIDSGPGWMPGQTVALTWANKAQPPLTADSNGEIHVTFTIPGHPTGVTYFQLSDTVLNQLVKKPFTIT